jgi:hypothetical protein
MNSDEKNKFGTTANQFDPDMRRDRYDEVKNDRNFQHSDKRNKQFTASESESGQIKHDPFNEKFIHKPKANENIHAEEMPTDKDLYHGDLIEHKRHIYQKPHAKEDKIIDMIDPKGHSHDTEKIKQHKVERVHEKRDQFPEIHNPNDNRHMRHAPH